MASDPTESPPAADDTVLVDPPAAGGEQTPVDGEWPVADLYYVEPDDETPAPRDEDATTVVAAAAAEPGGRRFPPDVERGVVLALLALLAVAGALILGALLLGGSDDPEASPQPPTSPPANPSTTTETSPAPAANADLAVRDVEGLGLARARAVLEKQGFHVSVRRSPSRRPPGEVLSQTPAAGAEVAKGAVVALVVARKAEPTPEQTARVEVPSVIGVSASSAVSTLRAASLEARVRLVDSSERSGTVVDQTPAEGAEVAEGTTIQLEVAKARPEVQRIAVPDVVGSSAEAARSELRSAGLRVRTVAVASQEPAGTVIAQSPRGGVKLREGATVRLTVSTGPTRVDVPDVTGLDEASATLELERAGFRVRVIDESIADPAEDGVVLRQSPIGGSSAQDGAVVTITVGRID